MSRGRRIVVVVFFAVVIGAVRTKTTWLFGEVEIMDCKVCVSTGDWWLMKGGGGGGGGGGQIVGGGLSLSQESEHDLALMVSDFLENGSGGTESWCSSDSDSGLSDLSLLADKIPVTLSLSLNLYI